MQRLIHLLLLSPCVYSRLLGGLGGLRRLRGGEDDAPPGVPGPDPVALTRKEITAKLDTVPAFMLVGEEGGFVSLQLKDGGGRAIVFFTEPEEAVAVLNMTNAQHTDAKIKLACVGLGTAFKLCGGWADDAEEVEEAFGADFDGTIMIQGASRLVSDLEPKLKAMMEEQGLAPGSWQLPIFICEQLQGPSMLPVFLNPRHIVDVWKRSGRPEAELPSQFVVMDLRMLVRDMGEPKLPWDRVQFAASPEAVKLANELQAELRSEGA